MKFIFTAFALALTFALDAQVISMNTAETQLELTENGSSEVFAFIKVRNRSKHNTVIEVSPINPELFAQKFDLVCSSMKQRYGIENDTPCELSTSEDGQSIIELKRPALWRAGHHIINAVSWSVGGSAIAISASLLGQPIVAGAVLVISSIGNIAQTVKSGRALKEASETDSVEPIREE